METILPYQNSFIELEGGYGFLPYDYVTNGLAEDWWTLIQQGWVDTGQFGE
jgi:C1A family cysteine protease